MNETSENVASTVAEQATEATGSVRDSTCTELSPLAKAQLRLEVEARARAAGRKTNMPIDHEFFNALEWSEQEMHEFMDSLGLASDFEELRKDAEARFPTAEPPENPVQWFVKRHKAYGWLGMKGVIASSALWHEAREKLTGEEFESYAITVGLAAGSQQRALIEKIATYHAKPGVESSEFQFWSEFALISLLEERFDLLLSLISDMGPMTADDLVQWFSEKSFQTSIDWKVESGGAPCVAYRFSKAPSSA